MALCFVEIYPRSGLTGRVHVGDVIGRSADCSVRLGDPTVSRVHARVWATEDCWSLEDLGSRNGVFLNGCRCQGVVPVRRGDIVRLGATVWLIAG